MFYVVERSIVILKPKLQFLDWLNSSLTTETILDLASIRIDCNSYLIPEINEIEDGINYVDENFESLFQLELASWTEDAEVWPQELTLKLFWEWFDVEISPTLVDLVGDEQEADAHHDTIH